MRALDKSKLKGIEATKTILDASAQERAAYWEAIRLENATRINRVAPAVSLTVSFTGNDGKSVMLYYTVTQPGARWIGI